MEMMSGRQIFITLTLILNKGLLQFDIPPPNLKKCIPKQYKLYLKIDSEIYAMACTVCFSLM